MTADPSEVKAKERENTVGKLLAIAFAAVVGFWLLYPALLDGGGAQDTLPFVAAGGLAHSDPGSVYPGDGGFFDMAPGFRSRVCEYYGGTPEECSTHTVPFVSPPPAIPFAVALSWAGAAASPFVRWLGAICLVSAMVIIWRTLAVRSLEARVAIVLSAALLTPLVKVPIDLGQLSPLLFLAVVLPMLGLATRRLQHLLGGVLGVIITIKVLPATLLVVPTLGGPRRVVAVALGAVVGLSAMSLIISGVTPWHRYVEFSSFLTDFARQDPYGGSVEKGFSELGVTSAVVSVGVRALALALVVLVFRWRDDFGARWAIVWAATMVVAPYVLSHYLFASVGAVAVAVAAGDQGRWRIWALPVAAVLTLPAALGREPTDHTAAVLFLTNLAILGLTSFLVLGTTRASEARSDALIG